MIPDLAEQRVHGLLRVRHIGAFLALGEMQFLVEKLCGFFVRQIGSEAASGGRREQRHHVAQPQIGGDALTRRFFPMHQRRAAIAPDGQRNRVADLFHELGHELARQANRIEPRQRCKAELERCGAEVVAAAARVLHDEAEPLVAHQITVRLGRAHAGGGGDVLEHQRAVRARQRFEQRKAHFHGLNAGAFLVHLH